MGNAVQVYMSLSVAQRRFGTSLMRKDEPLFKAGLASKLLACFSFWQKIITYTDAVRADSVSWVGRART